MNYIELMVTRPNLKCLFLSGLMVLGLNYLRVVFEYVGETSPRQDSLPQEVGFDSVGIGRVTGAVIPALIERQKPRAFAFKMRTEAYFLIVDREMSYAPAEFEKLFARIAIALV